MKTFRNSRPEVFCKKYEACNFIKKETLAQVFSCEFYEISKNTFSYRTPPVDQKFQTYLKQKGKKRYILIEWHQALETLCHKSYQTNNSVMMELLRFFLLLTAIWLPQGQLEGAASLT